MKIKITFSVLLVCCLWQFANAQKKEVRAGNKSYQQNNFKEAAEAYQQAIVKNPNFTPALFNLGNALIKQEQYDNSRKALTAAAKQSKEKHVKANAQYNIGNTFMHEQKWKEAVEAYKEALRKNPQDEAAKYNLSYALAKLKQEQQSGGQEQKQEQNKDQQKQEQQEQNQDQEKQDQNKQEQKQQEQKNQETPSENEQKEEDQKGRQPQPSKLSEQQADQLLNALSQEEKKLQEKKEKGKGIRIKMEKDW